MRGCIAFDCHGAGQLASGRFADAGPLRMQAAFRDLLEVHRALALLLAAQKLPLPKAEQSALASHIRNLAPDAVWSEETLPTARGQVAEAKTFLRSLARVLDPSLTSTAPEHMTRP